MPFIEGTVLVNLGALMQNWTSDVYQATVSACIIQIIPPAHFTACFIFTQPHRVLIPEDELKRKAARQCVAFFIHPDNEVLVECVDGSNKYPAITAAEDIRRRLDRIYTNTT